MSGSIWNPGGWINTASAAFISYLNNLTNAVARTVENRLQEVVYANDFDDITIADAAAFAAGLPLCVGKGTYIINTNYDFNSIVNMEGGVITGTGTVRFLGGVESPRYYWADINVALIEKSDCYPEWFGANKTGSVSSGIATKPWNTWPSWVTGATFLSKPGHDYGDGAFLAANKPFLSGTDTWDFLGMQRALWACGVPTTHINGGSRILLTNGSYKINKALQWTGESSAGILGTGQLASTFTSNNWATHQSIGTADFGVAKMLFRFYRGGPSPVDIQDLGLVGPTGFVPVSAGGPYAVILLSQLNNNGLALTNVWFATCDVGNYAVTSSSDNRNLRCMFEFCQNAYYTSDDSQAMFLGCSFWQSWVYASKVAHAPGAFVQILSGQFVGYTNPFNVSVGSIITGDFRALNNQAYYVDCEKLSGTCAVAVGTTAAPIKMVVPTFTASRYTFTVSGLVQGVGSYGGQAVYTASKEGGAPTLISISNTEWGNAGAQALIALTVAAGAGDEIEFRIQNTGAGGQSFSGRISLTGEGCGTNWQFS